MRVLLVNLQMLNCVRLSQFFKFTLTEKNVKKLNAVFITVLISAGLGVSISFAQTSATPPKGEHAHKMHERFKAADKDGDGKISREEAIALPRIAKHFDEIDTNKDGFITKEEMRAFHEKRMAQRTK